MHALVREAAELLSRACDQKRIGLILDLADDMPPIPADPGGVHQVLMNVLINAVEAAPAKKGVITVKSQFDAAAQRAIISVSDNGPGIDPMQQDEIFEAFSSNKGHRGTGLGLAVARKIVQEHSGEIELESALGEGSTFSISLPSDRGDLDASDTRLPRPLPLDDPDEGGF